MEIRMLVAIEPAVGRLFRQKTNQKAIKKPPFEVVF